MAATAILCCCHSAGETRDELVLTEFRTSQIPSWFEPAGGAVSSTGEVVLWSSGRPEIFYHDAFGHQSMLDIGLHDGPTAVAFVPGDSCLEAIVGLSRRILRFTKQGAIVSERFLSGWADAVEIQSAGLTIQGWVVAAKVHDGGLLLFHEYPNGGSQVVYRVSKREFVLGLPDSLATLAAHVFADDHWVVMSLWWPPFYSFAFRDDSSPPLIIRPLTQAHDVRSGDTTVALKVALQALPTGGRFLQTIADLKSDTRELALFNSDGRELRRTSLNAPIGYVATANDGRLVLAIRKTDVNEIVIYQSRWRSRTKVR